MKNILFLSLISILFASCSSNQTNQDLLQGTWVDTEDPKSKIIVDENEWAYAYTDEDDYKCSFILSGDCVETESQENKPNASHITVFEDGYATCYSISKLDNENLEIIYLDRGNTLVYKKQKK